MVCIPAEHEVGVVELHEVQLAIHMALLGRSTVRPSVFPLSGPFLMSILHLTFINMLGIVRSLKLFTALGYCLRSVLMPLHLQLKRCVNREESRVERGHRGTLTILSVMIFVPLYMN
jgi:hypothetical protein